MFTIDNVLKQSSFDGIEAHINVRIGECSEAPYLGILIEVQDQFETNSYCGFDGVHDADQWLQGKFINYNG